jgi:hypothetical protein
MSVRTCKAALALLALAPAAQAQTSWPTTFTPQFPHNLTLQPGRLYHRTINLERVTALTYIDGEFYSVNVSGAAERKWKFNNLSDLNSWTKLLDENDGQTVDFPLDAIGSHAYTHRGIDPATGSRYTARFNPGVPSAANSQGTNDFTQYPWNVPHVWLQYGPNTGLGWIYRDSNTNDQTLIQWDLRGQTGITGKSFLLGNIYLVASDATNTGVATLDLAPVFQNPAKPPVLLDKLTGSTGAYLAAIWEHYLILMRQDTSSLDMIDFSDPTALRLVASIPLAHVNSFPYIQFQDNYAFTCGNKVNLETRQVEMVFDLEGNGVAPAGFSDVFVPRPAGSITGALDATQHMMPLGNLVLTGGYKFTGKDGIGIWAHQAAPDTKRPYVGYHLPRPGQTNFPLGAPIVVMIHETLETRSIINGQTVILRRVGTTTPIDCWTSFNDQDLLTITPKSHLSPNTEYEVVLVDNGIKDAVGNGLVGHTFRFSTGATTTANLVPAIASFTASPSPVAPGATVTFSVAASDPEGTATLQYRFSAGDGTPLTAWGSATSYTHTYADAGHYEAKIQVREAAATANLSSKTSVVTVATAPAGPRPTHSSTMALTGGGSSRRLWTVNPDNDSLAWFNPASATPTLGGEIDLAALLGLGSASVDPRSLAVDANDHLWVACHDADLVAVLTNTGVLKAAFPLGYGSAPIGVAASPNGQAIYVTTTGRAHDSNAAANPGHGQLLRFNATGSASFTGSTAAPLTGRLALGPTPRAIAITGNGQRVLVTRFLSELNHGEIWDINASNASSLGLTRTIQLARDRGPRDEADNAALGRGVPNYLSSIAIDPAGDYAWYTAVKANTERGLLFQGSGTENGTLDPENTVRAIAGRVSLSSNNEPSIDNNLGENFRIDIDNSDSPSAIAFTQLNDYAFVALQGSNNVAVFDNLKLRANGGHIPNKQPTWRVGTGLAPQGLLYDDVTKRLFAQNLMGRSVTVVDLAGFIASGDRAPNQSELVTRGAEKLPAAVFRGKKLFYNANDNGGPAGENRMSFEGYISCASCHLDGAHDGRTWDFTQRGEGLRNTTDLRGRAGLGHGNVHWTANFDELQDFVIDIVDEFGGTGFPHGANPHAPLGTSNAGDPDLADLAAYLTSLGTASLPRSPHRESSGALSAAALRGRDLFNGSALACATCHVPSTGYTNSGSGANPPLSNVGTLRTTSGQRLGATLTGIDVPTTLGLWDGAPYFHDGSATTLDEVFKLAGGTVIQAETGSRSGSAKLGSGLTQNYDASARGNLVQLDANGDKLTFSNVDGGSTAGAGMIEFRAAAKRVTTTGRLTVNGANYSYTVPSPNQRTWVRVLVENVALTAGATNTITFEQTSADDIFIDEFLVITPQRLTAANAHRRVLNRGAAEQSDLKAYLLELDGRTDSGALPGTTQPTSPAAPTNVSATATSATAVTLHYTDASTDETGFNIEHKVAGASTWTAAADGSSSSGSGTARTASITNLAANTSYAFRVRSYKTGATPSAWVEATATTPAEQSGGGYVQADGLLVMEAENATIQAGTGTSANPSWEVLSIGDASGGSAASTPNTPSASTTHTTADSSALRFDATFTSTGTHYLWVRARALVANGGDDSVNYSLDNGALVRLNTNNTTSWTWVKSATALNVSGSGLHTLRLHVRENGTQIDKVLLTTDNAYTPSGNGPAETLGAALPAAPTGVSATATSSSAATVSYTDASSDETGFDIEYKLTSASTWTAAPDGSASSGTGTAKTASLTGLTANSNYEVRVRSYNANGESGWVGTTFSTPAQATTLLFEAESLPHTESDTVTTYNEAPASGGSYDFLAANAVGDYIEYTLNVPTAATYAVSLRYKAMASRGITQLTVDGTPVGSPLDQRASGFLSANLGSIPLAPGNRTFRFQVTGTSGTGYSLSFDSITLTP